jgi:hypothetical protein
MEPQSPRDGRALRDVARLANSPVSRGPMRRANSDSGIVDLAALMAEEPTWLDSAVARAKTAAGSFGPPPLVRGSLAPPSLSPASLAPTTSAVDATFEIRRRTRSLPLVLAAMGAGLLVAAACVFALRIGVTHSPAPSAAPPVAAVAHVDAPAAAPPPPATPAAAPLTAVGAPIDTGAAQTAATPESPQARAVEGDGPPVGRHWRHGRHEARAATETRAAAPVAATAADAPPPPARAIAAPAPPPPHVGSALDAALRAAAGPVAAAAPAAPAPVGAKTAPPPVADGRPERPSGSAVTGTLNEVLGKARHCVDGMGDASRALVTFGSDGAVRKVDITGPAASDGKAAQCLRGALGRAHVPPFASASYAAGVTVRPE